MPAGHRSFLEPHRFGCACTDQDGRTGTSYHRAHIPLILGSVPGSLSASSSTLASRMHSDPAFRREHQTSGQTGRSRRAVPERLRRGRDVAACHAQPVPHPARGWDAAPTSTFRPSRTASPRLHSPRPHLGLHSTPLGLSRNDCPTRVPNQDGLAGEVEPAQCRRQRAAAAGTTSAATRT